MSSSAAADTTTTPTPEPSVAAAWEDTRCRKCGRLMFKNTVNPLRAGAMLEKKCDSCNTLNYLVGRPEL